MRYGDDSELVEDLYAGLFRYAAVVGSGHSDPDDLVQEALAATLAVHSLVELEYPAAYLRRAILTAALRAQRRRGLFERLAPMIGAETHTEPTYPSDVGDLEHLDPRDRAILYLVHVHGLSYAQVGDELNENEATCRQRASRARKRLRAELRAEDSDHD